MAIAVTLQLPQFKDGEYDPAKMRRFVEEVERLVRSLNSRLGSEAYTVTNDTPDREFDADATSTGELADVLGTLISDLQSKNIIG